MAHERRFNPALAGRLENPDRLRYLPPAEIVAALDLRPGMVIADIGAGTGYFALPLAKAAGPDGKIYAVDAQPQMLALLAEKPRDAAAAPIEPIRAEAHATHLPNGGCGLVFMANVWHEFDDRAAVVGEAKRLLCPGGRIGILDWRPDVEPEQGPPLDHRLSSEDALDLLRSAGAAQVGSRNIGRYSWLVTATFPRE